jgi:hypothetical protein
MIVKANPLTPMKLTVRTINALGFVFYLGYIGLLSAMFGMPSKLYLSTFLMLTPFLYFLVCIATSFARHRSKSVLLTGIVIHGIITVASVAALTEECYWPVGLFIIYAVTWFMMYFKLSPA